MQIFLWLIGNERFEIFSYVSPAGVMQFFPIFLEAESIPNYVDLAHFVMLCSLISYTFKASYKCKSKVKLAPIYNCCVPDVTRLSYIEFCNFHF